MTKYAQAIQQIVESSGCHMTADQIFIQLRQISPINCSSWPTSSPLPRLRPPKTPWRKKRPYSWRKAPKQTACTGR